jgi:osmoprotectant transport system permease protein
MQIFYRRLAILQFLFLMTPLLSAQTSCRIAVADTPYQAIIKEIVRSLVLPSEEFKSVMFMPMTDGDVDVTVDRKEPSPHFHVGTKKNFPAKFPKTWKNLQKLEGQLTDDVLRHLAERMAQKKSSAKDTADIFIGSLNWKRLEENKPAEINPQPHFSRKPEPSSTIRLEKMVGKQLLLVLLPLAVAFLLGAPTAKRLYANNLTKGFLLSLTNIFLTIPPIAFLCLFIPSYGFGVKAMAVAIFIFDLLVLLKFSAPLASVKSAVYFSKLRQLAVTNVGLVTLAGFLGVGGFGNMISLGLTLNDTTLIMKGAMGAAVLAMAMKWIFEALEWVLSRRGRRDGTG